MTKINKTTVFDRKSSDMRIKLSEAIRQLGVLSPHYASAHGKLDDLEFRLKQIEVDLMEVEMFYSNFIHELVRLRHTFRLLDEIPSHEEERMNERKKALTSLDRYKEIK